MSSRAAIPSSMLEHHRSNRVGWLRAAVLGANDGILSTASLIVGVAAAQTARPEIIIAGISGLVAGALSMAAGEYVSVSSQADTEAADLATEKLELANNVKFEQEELADIYVGRGLEPELAKKVAIQLMAHDALGSHARDELGITDTSLARPIQAALASAASFSVGAILPLIIAYIVPTERIIAWTSLASILSLAFLGALAAHAGGASLWKGAARVTFWGIVALGVTAGIGRIFGHVL